MKAQILKLVFLVIYLTEATGGIEALAHKIGKMVNDKRVNTENSLVNTREWRWFGLLKRIEQENSQRELL